MRAFYLASWLLAPMVAFSQTPRFKDYVVYERYTGRQVAPKLKPGTDAWYFRTRIREAARQKPNFAGHYILARWGCGAECLESAIIDVTTGKVYMVDFTVCCLFSNPALANTELIDFRLNSQLIIFNGLLNEEGQNEAHYYRFAHGKLTALH